MVVLRVVRPFLQKYVQQNGQSYRGLIILPLSDQSWVFDHTEDSSLGESLVKFKVICIPLNEMGSDPAMKKRSQEERF